MTKAPLCPGCRAEVSADAPDGLCPECLFQRIIEGRDGAEEPTAAHTPAPVSVPPSPAEVGRHFPQLEVLDLLGQGGMGAVYKARQTKLDRRTRSRSPLERRCSRSSTLVRRITNRPV